MHIIITRADLLISKPAPSDENKKVKAVPNLKEPREPRERARE